MKVKRPRRTPRMVLRQTCIGCGARALLFDELQHAEYCDGEWALAMGWVYR
jgi:hypothetical protein